MMWQNSERTTTSTTCQDSLDHCPMPIKILTLIRNTSQCRSALAQEAGPSTFACKCNNNVPTNSIGTSVCSCSIFPNMEVGTSGCTIVSCLNKWICPPRGRLPAKCFDLLHTILTLSVCVSMSVSVSLFWPKDRHSDLFCGMEVKVICQRLRSPGQKMFNSHLNCLSPCSNEYNVGCI